jgi:hypothetical protein
MCSDQQGFTKWGFALVVAAICGGGVTAFGVELPLVRHPWQLGLLAGLGLILIAVGRWPHLYCFHAPSSSISRVEGTMSDPHFRTTVFGGQRRQLRVWCVEETDDRVVAWSPFGKVSERWPKAAVRSYHPVRRGQPCP